MDGCIRYVLHNSSLARWTGPRMAEQRAGVGAGPRAATGAPARVCHYRAALELWRADRAAHTAVIRRYSLVCVLAGWAAPFTF